MSGSWGSVLADLFPLALVVALSPLSIGRVLVLVLSNPAASAAAATAATPVPVTN
jgi:hypothetical protein